MISPHFGMQFQQDMNEYPRLRPLVSGLGRKIPRGDDGLTLSVLSGDVDGKPSIKARFSEQGYVVAEMERVLPRLLQPVSVIGWLQDVLREATRLAAEGVAKQKNMPSFIQEVRSKFDSWGLQERDERTGALKTASWDLRQYDDLIADLIEMHYELLNDGMDKYPDRLADQLVTPEFSYLRQQIRRNPEGDEMHGHTEQSGRGLHIVEASSMMGGSIIQRAERGGKYLAFDSRDPSAIHQSGDHALFVIQGTSAHADVNQRGNDSQFIYLGSNGNAEVTQQGDNSHFAFVSADHSKLRVDPSKNSDFTVFDGNKELKLTLFGSPQDWRETTPHHYVHKQSGTHVKTTERVHPEFQKMY